MSIRVNDWDDLRYFLAAVRAGSLAGAARSLRVDPTTVSRRLSAFESRLGVKLFDRLRGGVLLTPDGQGIAVAAEEVEARVAAMERRLASGQQALRGAVRIAVPELIAVAWVDLWARLATDHPGLSLALVEGDAMSNLTRREADLAVRVTKDPPEHLVGRKLGTVALGAYGIARWCDDPVHAPWVGWTGLSEDESVMRHLRPPLGAEGPVVLRVSSYATFLQALRSGMGLGVLPELLGAREPLERVGDLYDMVLPLWVLTHPDLRATPRIRAVMDGIVAFHGA